MHSAAATVVAAHARSASRPLNMQRIARMSAKTSTVQPMATLCMRNALRRWAPTASIPVHDRPLRCFSGTSAAASRRSFSSGDDIADPRLANGDPANNVPFDVARKVRSHRCCTNSQPQLTPAPRWEGTCICRRATPLT